MCVIADDRTPEQKQTHRWGVVMRDSFLSGWGQAKHGYSRCAWAFETLDDAEIAESRVRARSDASYVRVVDLRQYRPPRGTAHFHIYVVTNRNHFTLQGDGGKP